MKHLNTLLLLIPVIWGFIPDMARADSDLYVRSELGMNFAPKMDISARSNDRASLCDEYINPHYDRVAMWHERYRNINCISSDRQKSNGWSNDFGSAKGILAGIAIGYRPGKKSGGMWENFRVEIEYFYRAADYDEVSHISSAVGNNQDKLNQEIVDAIDAIDSLASHNLFANIYYDFINNSRFTPYIGVGIGLGRTSLDYESLWVRNSDPDNIRTGEYIPDGPLTTSDGSIISGADLKETIRENLAGSFSLGEKEYKDTLFGYQLLVGVDYALTEKMALGLKARYVEFESFNDDGLVWDPLRSHVPNIRRDGSEPVQGYFKTSDIRMFGVSLNLAYYF